MDKRRVRDTLRLANSVFFSFLYLPHVVLVILWGGVRKCILEDVKATGTDTLNLSGIIGLLYLLHNDRYFRKLFYYRIGPIWSLLISWYRPGDKYFVFSFTTKIGPGVKIAHPFSTVLNASYIGSNFSCLHCTTLGKKNNKRPVIGNNVSLGANVTIIGDVHIGNNVIIGAGSVVIKDIPDNCVVAGNPSKILKSLS